MSSSEIRSFSGTHAYRASCVSEAAKLAGVTDFGWSPDDPGMGKIGEHWAGVVTERVRAGQCPRCRGALPVAPVMPAGSRVTACRCIPVCGICGTDEAFYPMPLWRWPTSRSAMSRRRNKREREHPPIKGVLQDGHVITELGVGKLIPREHPGGWAEFGYDDEPDEQ